MSSMHLRLCLFAALTLSTAPTAMAIELIPTTKQWQKEQTAKIKSARPPSNNDELNKKIRDSL